MSENNTTVSQENFGMKRDKYWEIQHIQSELEKAYEHTYNQRQDMLKNWEMFSGFDYGQWDKEAKSNLKDDNRHIVQFNFIRGKINGLAGTMLKNPYDIDYVPTDGAYTTPTNIIKEIYYSDKEMMEWDHEYAESLRDGLISEGIEQMTISEEYNELGNIKFERIMPGHIILDPNWKSINDKMLKKIWKIAYLTPKEISEIYPKSKKKIEEYLYRQHMNGVTYEDDASTETVPYFNLDDNYGTKYKVIEEHAMVPDKRKVRVVMTDDDKTLEVPEDVDEQVWLQENGFEADTPIVTKNISKDVYYVKTVCPSLMNTEFLENRKSEIQIGRLPFFIWSAARINGRNSGIVELLIDAQQTLNKRESLTDHIIATEAHGALALDPMIVGNDEGQFKTLLDNINKPDARIRTAPGALASGRQYIQRIPSAQFNPEVLNQVSRMADYVDKISQQTSALEGQQGSANEPGILFARRVAQAETALTMLGQSLERYIMNKAEAFMLLAQDLYSGTYREFTAINSDGKVSGTVAVNEEVETPFGTQVVNDIASLPRHKVVLSKSPVGVTVRETTRAINGDLLGKVPQTNPITRSKILKNVVMTMDTSERERDEYTEAAMLEEQYAVEQVLTGIAQMRSERKQMEMAEQQMEAQAAAMAGGQPPEAQALSGQTAEAEAAQQQAATAEQ